MKKKFFKVILGPNYWTQQDKMQISNFFIVVFSHNQIGSLKSIWYSWSGLNVSHARKPQNTLFNNSMKMKFWGEMTSWKFSRKSEHCYLQIS